jgi:hypothetical protein
MSAYERRRFAVAEQRLAIYYRDGGICQSCHRPVSIQAFQVAHRIADTVSNRKRYGGHVVDHALNKSTTHAGKCNDAQNCGFNPVQCAEIVKAIREADRWVLK